MNLKILNDKIKASPAQFDLDREAAKISALLSKELDKYEYLAVEDLGYKPRVVKKVKFEYSPFGEALSKGLKKMYDSVHNFNKYSVFNFNKITSVDSRFDTLNKFYKEF